MDVIEKYAAEDAPGAGELAIVPVLFEIVMEADPRKPGELIEVEYVTVAKKGVQNQAHTRDKVKRLMKDTVVWPGCVDHYNAWKAGEGAPISGIPLKDWGKLPGGMIDVLRATYKVLSVEDFASMPDDGLAGLKFPNVRAFQSKAKDYLRDIETTNVLRNELDAKDVALAELQAKVDAMEKRDSKQWQGKKKA